MMMDNMVNRVVDGDKRAAARLITMIENDDHGKEVVLNELYQNTGKAYVVGITGSPGAGKSSLTDQLTKEIRKTGKTVGIIAVDPSSPFSGGAILGDRIRMQDHACDEGVFIRSMGSRGSLGGLSYGTAESIKVMDAYGCDVIILETVGVGQSEFEVMHYADTVLVVLTPGMGDGIQAIKAGIMEIADIFVVNKGDLPGADRVIKETGSMLDMKRKGEYRPDVVKVSALKHDGFVELWAAINKHMEYQINQGILEVKRDKRVRDEITEKAIRLMRKKVLKALEGTNVMDNIFATVKDRQISPEMAAVQLLKETIGE